MHDIIITSQLLSKQRRNCKAVISGAKSHHVTIAAKIAITPIKFKITAVTNGRVFDWSKIVSKAGYKNIFNKNLKVLFNAITFYNAFNESTMKAAA